MESSRPPIALLSSVVMSAQSTLGVHRRDEGEVLRAEQRCLTDLRGHVLGQLDVPVQRYRHQRMPVLHSDGIDRPDGDVIDHDR